MSKNLRALQSRKADAVTNARAITDTATAAGRDLTTDEVTAFDSAMSNVNSLSASIDREQALIAQESQMSIIVRDDAVITVSENVAADPKGGFKHAGDYFKAVYGASQSRTTGNPVDQRLLIGAAAPGTFSGEGSGTDGGFAVPPGYASDIFQLSLTDNALLPYCDEVNIDGNTMSFPKDETTPWGTNGVRAYWQGEGVSATATKPVLGLNTLRLKKLMALVPVSDELLSDGAALAGYLPKKIGASIQWKANEAILFGAGGNLPTGALNSGAAITVVKDSGQATATLSAMNLANMIARLPEGSFPNSVWIINNDVLPALFTLTLGNYPIYLPTGMAPGGIQISPYGTLLGRPIIVSQHAKSFSTAGDVNLVDLSYYQAITKAGGVQTATSMHLYFDADATAFRTIFRMDGLSKLAAAITPANGTTKLSPFVQLGAR